MRGAEYCKDAVKELKAAVAFARSDGGAHGWNGSLLAEACYILCHILRYQESELQPERAGHAVEFLREAFKYTKEVEGPAKHASRHKCEALLALCGVYADMAKRDISLSEVNTSDKSNASPTSLSRVYACKVLDVNNRANNRISAICYLAPRGLEPTHACEGVWLLGGVAED